MRTSRTWRTTSPASSPPLAPSSPSFSVARRELADDHPAADAVRRAFAPLDLAAQLLDALAHAAQAKAMRPGARVAPETVVDDRQVDPVVLEAEIDLDPLRLRVRNDVADQLAQHPRDRGPLHHAEQDVL